MKVTLEAIKFNHDPASHATDALNVRRNAAVFVEVPEWRRGVTTRPDDSPAAYAREETRGRSLTVRALLSGPAGSSVEVRALARGGNPPASGPGESGPAPPAGGPEERGPAPLAARSSGWFGRLFGEAPGANVLGEVAERPVEFDSAGQSGFVPFELKRPRLWRAGVGVYTTTWLWQFRLRRDSPWVDLETTSHRVYVVLEAPRSPWRQGPYDRANTQLPWTEALDVACLWAGGAKDQYAAAGRITSAVHNLGGRRFTYDFWGGAATRYTGYDGALYLTEFLERVSGGLGLGEYANSTDCASFVATLANVLGCDLCEITLGWDFHCNDVRVLGAPEAGPSLAGLKLAFHEVAWLGPGSDYGEVFDACVRTLGAGRTRAGSARKPGLALGLPFGAAGSGGYRDRLAALTGRAWCVPQCVTMRRREVV